MDSSQSAPLNHHRPEGDVVPLVSKDLPTAEEARFPPDPDAGRDSPDQWVGMAREGSDFFARLPAVQPFPLLSKDLPTAEEARFAHEPDAGLDSPDQRIGMAREGSDFSAELPAVQQSIRVPPRPCGLNDQFASDKPSIGRRTFRRVARFLITALIAALIGVAGSSAWQSHGDEAKKIVRAWAPSLRWLSSAWQPRGDEAKKMVRTWVSSLDSLLSISMTKSPPDFDIAAKQPGPTRAGPAQDAALPQSAPITQKPAPAAVAISPELVQQLNALARDLAIVRHSVEQLAAKQEQMAHNIATLQAVAQDIGQKMSSPPPSRAGRPRKPPQPIAQSSAVQSSSESSSPPPAQPLSLSR
jgi:hypothetical protein